MTVPSSSSTRVPTGAKVLRDNGNKSKNSNTKNDVTNSPHNQVSMIKVAIVQACCAMAEQALHGPTAKDETKDTTITIEAAEALQGNEAISIHGNDQVPHSKGVDASIHKTSTTTSFDVVTHDTTTMDCQSSSSSSSSSSSFELYPEFVQEFRPCQKQSNTTKNESDTATAATTTTLWQSVLDAKLFSSSSSSSISHIRQPPPPTTTSTTTSTPTTPATSEEPVVVDWDSLPPSLHPSSPLAELTAERARSKQYQVEAVLRHALPIIDALSLLLAQQQQSSSSPPPPPLRIVEFGAGSGHVGLVLAAALRKKKGTAAVHVTLVERKEYACQQAQRRADQAGLTWNDVRICCQSLHEYVATAAAAHKQQQQHYGCDLALALHSCGVLTDAILTWAVQQKAAFFVVPCCYGQVAAHLPAHYLPRSQRLAAMHRHCTKKEEQDQNGNASSAPSSPSSMALQKALTAHLSCNVALDLSTNKQRRQYRKLIKSVASSSPFVTIAQAADCTTAVNGTAMSEAFMTTTTTSFIHSPNFQLAKRCMQWVDADRLWWVQQCGRGSSGDGPSFYPYLRLSSLYPLHLTPKNNVICGICTAHNDNNVPDVDTTAMIASARENRHAEAGEKSKTGQDGFRNIQT